MSNAVRYEPLLVHYLAEELNRRLGSRGTTAAPFFAPELSVTLPLAGGEQLRVDLHPTRGWVRLLPDPTEPDLDLDGVITRVDAPPDERRLHLGLLETGRFREEQRTLILELHTNQWNAVLVGGDGRIQNVLRPRRAGTRMLYAGETYEPPAGKARYGVERADREEALRRWWSQLEPLPEEARKAAMLAHFAWTGALSADWILRAGDLETAFERWWWLRGRPPPDPVILDLGDTSQPYPVRLVGVPGDSAASLLDAMATLAAQLPEPTAAEAPVDRALALARERAAEAARRAERLARELTDAEDADQLQTLGDLLLARLRDVPRGASVVELEGWEGEPIRVELDPRLTPAENANRYYELAGRRRRARERLPGLLRQAELEHARWLEVERTLAAGGDLPEWLSGELRREEERTPSAREAGSALPYRTYRTSGGLEVRVGRSARDNDRLTFHASSPEDVWLHAQSVPGSHVILRWSDPSTPPARDLTEAAQIAAVFSRARTSGTVAVDWTRRKYVRKPRGAPPGAVIPQRVRTLFVEPDQEVVEALRER